MESPVITFAWFGISENDTCCHRICALNITVVETFNMLRDICHAKILLQLPKDSFCRCLLGGFHLLPLALHEKVANILQRQIKELFFLTTHRYGLSYRRINKLYAERDNDLFCITVKFFTQPVNCKCKQLTLIFVEIFLQFLCITID